MTWSICASQSTTAAMPLSRIERAGSVDYFLAAEPWAVSNGTWRVGDIETKAPVLFARKEGSRVNREFTISIEARQCVA